MWEWYWQVMECLGGADAALIVPLLWLGRVGGWASLTWKKRAFESFDSNLFHRIFLSFPFHSFGIHFLLFFFLVFIPRVRSIYPSDQQTLGFLPYPKTA